MTATVVIIVTSAPTKLIDELRRHTSSREPWTVLSVNWRIAEVHFINGEMQLFSVQSIPCWKYGEYQLILEQCVWIVFSSFESAYGMYQRHTSGFQWSKQQLDNHEHYHDLYLPIYMGFWDRKSGSLNNHSDFFTQVRYYKPLLPHSSR